MRNNVYFIDMIPRHRLKSFVAEADIAVVASQFEMYGVIAHVLRELGVPLILSDIPTFRDWFSDDLKVALFHPVNASQLAIKLSERLAQRGMLPFSNDRVNNAKHSAAGRDATLRHADPMVDYSPQLSRKQDNQLIGRRFSMLEQQLDRMIKLTDHAWEDEAADTADSAVRGSGVMAKSKVDVVENLDKALRQAPRFH
jgi:hypothetical protein